MKRLEVAGTPQSARELKKIVDRIYATGGHRRTADRYGEKIVAAALRIGDASEAGRPRDDLERA